MAYNFDSLKNKLEDKVKWLSSEMSGLRTGKASPAILDNIVVDSYGAMTPISHVASVTISDARTLRVTPWDKSLLVAIEKAIVYANLGLSVNVDGHDVRVAFPELTADRRKSLTKVAKEKCEEARIALRHERDVVWEDIQTQTKDGTISEDDKFRAKDSLQKVIDEYNKKLEDLYSKKERELSE
ncbi:MAG: ribosome recycling factor [Candidatus Paceibacterota bacterium]|jgi:ribosome recycling factor